MLAVTFAVAPVAADDDDDDDVAADSMVLRHSLTHSLTPCADHKVGLRTTYGSDPWNPHETRFGLRPCS